MWPFNRLFIYYRFWYFNSSGLLWRNPLYSKRFYSKAAVIFLCFRASDNTFDQPNEHQTPSLENEQTSSTKIQKVNAKPTKREIVESHYVYPPEPSNKIHTETHTFGTTYEDADKAFLLSLLPDYKKLSGDEKIDFRLHTLQFFRNLRKKQETS